MKRMIVLLVCIAFMAGPALVQAGDVTAPGDPVIGFPNNGDGSPPTGNWPDGEPPEAAIDNNAGTKYLHFDGEIAPGAGIQVTPSRGSTYVGGLTLTTANDDDRRDPATFQLSGSNDGGTTWTPIASGSANLPGGRGEMGPIIRFVELDSSFVPVAYTSYKLMFPTIKDVATGMMQIAEIELLEVGPTGGWMPSVDAGPDQALLLPVDSLTMNPTIDDYDSSPEDLTYSWSLLAGPAAADFGGTENNSDAVVTFPGGVAGIYTLELYVIDESGNDANDIIEVHVFGLDPDDDLVGHWKFNDGPDSLIAVDSVADGTTGLIDSRPEGGDPNWIEGWIPSEAPDNWALDFLDLGYVKVDPNDALPHADLDQEFAITIAAWMKPLDWDGNRRILQKGLSDNQYRLLAENDAFRFHLAGVGMLTTALPTTGVWHHVAATYDHSTMKIFFDGVEVASQAGGGNIATSSDPLYIGTKSEFVDPAVYPGDYFNGKLDDVRIYGRPLTQSEVRDLVAMGANAACAIDSINAPDTLVLSVVNYIDIDAVVFDAHGDTINYGWSSSDPANVTFDSAYIEDPRVTFEAEGVYTLRLTIDDGVYGLDADIYKEITIAVTNPTCQETIDAGFTIAGDLNDDCHVDFADVAIMAINWAKCITPGEAGCENPWAQ
ncbi:MAG: LamG domain-containing protein [Planctomycetes bacterium]|nr:LamG domain-containing protein [Planctomycetota bacterium]